MTSLEVLTYDGECFWACPSSEDETERIIAAGERKEQIYLDLCDMVLDPGVEQQDC